MDPKEVEAFLRTLIDLINKAEGMGEGTRGLLVGLIDGKLETLCDVRSSEAFRQRRQLVAAARRSLRAAESNSVDNDEAMKAVREAFGGVDGFVKGKK